MVLIGSWFVLLFFHLEVSCNGLNSRQACRANSNLQAGSSEFTQEDPPQRQPIFISHQFSPWLYQSVIQLYCTVFLHWTVTPVPLSSMLRGRMKSTSCSPMPPSSWGGRSLRSNHKGCPVARQRWGPCWSPVRMSAKWIGWTSFWGKEMQTIIEWGKQGF